MMFARLMIIFTLFTTPALAQTAPQTAYFAGGCFWCTEADFEKIDGVIDVVSGFMGGRRPNPAYKDVAGGRTQHRETVKVVFDPKKTSYQKLLSAFWRMHDPSDDGGSFVDRGRQYGSAIFTTNAAQAKLARGGKAALVAAKKFSRPIATEISAAGAFYMAEDYHQNYYKRNPLRYRFYRARSGRDTFIEQVWKGDNRVYQTE